MNRRAVGPAQLHAFARTGERGRRLAHEAHHPERGAVVLPVARTADELAWIGDRRQQRHLVERGRRLVCRQIGHDVAQVGQVLDKLVARRQRPAQRRQPRGDGGHVADRIVDHHPQPRRGGGIVGLREPADLHGSTSSPECSAAARIILRSRLAVAPDVTIAGAVATGCFAAASAQSWQVGPTAVWRSIISRCEPVRCGYGRGRRCPGSTGGRSAAPVPRR